MTKDASTEEKIKLAARSVFVKKGFSGARMQEIADEAGINKAMLHYYYRSKDKMFDAVFTELFDDFAPRMVAALGADLSLEQKVQQYAKQVISMLSDHPELPIFIFNELKSNPNNLLSKIGLKESGALDVMNQQLKAEIAAGNIRPIHLHEFMVNMAAMCVFPFLAKPLFQGLFDINDDTFLEFMELRKKSIPEYVMHAISLK